MRPPARSAAPAGLLAGTPIDQHSTTGKAANRAALDPEVSKSGFRAVAPASSFIGTTSLAASLSQGCCTVKLAEGSEGIC